MDLSTADLFRSSCFPRLPAFGGIFLPVAKSILSAGHTAGGATQH